MDNRHSKEISEIIEKSPTEVYRWGYLVLTLVFLGAILLSLLVHFPEMISANIRIVSHDEAVLTIPRSEIKKIQYGQPVILDLNNIEGACCISVPGVTAETISTGNKRDSVDILVKYQSGGPIVGRAAAFGLGKVILADHSLFQRVWYLLFSNPAH